MNSLRLILEVPIRFGYGEFVGDLAIDRHLLKDRSTSAAERITMKKCLIVDDELFCGELLAHMLMKHFECTTVTSGKEAWETIESNWRSGVSFDLICCDLTMPKLSGHGLIRKIRALEETAPEPKASPSVIFVVSAGTYPWEMGEELLDDVTDGYLAKPCNPKELYALLLQHGLVESDQIGQHPDR